MSLSTLRFTPSTHSSVSTVRYLLQSTGIHIPVHARGAYNTLSMDSTDFRLYVWVWPKSVVDSSEWMLLVVLECLNPGDRSGQVHLRIQDKDQVLIEQTHTDVTTEQYLFGQVLGDRHEQFQVTVEMDNQSITLPSFRFNPDEL